MFRKDFLEKQLEELGLVIAKLIGDFLDVKQEISFSRGTEKVNEALQTEFNISLEEIQAIDKDKLIEHLTQTKQLKTGTLNLLADLLFATATFIENSENPGPAKDLFSKTLLLYDHVNKEQKTFSEARQQKINTLKSKI